MMASIGIDFGTLKSVCARVDDSGLAIALNGLSNAATPSLVSFKGKQRLVGESALGQKTLNVSSTVNDLFHLLGLAKKEDSLHFDSFKFNIENREEGGVILPIEYTFSSTEEARVHQWHPEHLVGAFLAHLRDFAVKENPALAVAPVVVAVPGCLPDSRYRSLLDALSIAKIDASVVSSATAVAYYYAFRHSETLSKSAEPQAVLFVNLGYSFLDLSVVVYENGIGKIVKNIVHEHLGTRKIDNIIFDHFREQILEKHKANIKKTSRIGARLLAQSEKLKEILSANPSNSFVLDGVTDSADANLNMTRSQLESISGEYRAAVVDAIKSIISSIDDDVRGNLLVELIGGGTRVPFVQAAIMEASGKEKLNRSLDSLSAIALGSALIGKAKGSANLLLQTLDFISPNVPSALSAQTINEIQHLEEQIMIQDHEIHLIFEKKNAIESFIFEIRQIVTEGKHANLIRADDILPLLEEVENWVFSEEAESASSQEYSTKLEDLKTKVHSAGAAYFDKIKADHESKLKQEEAQAKIWAEERANEVKEDKDFRKLKNGDRIRLAVRNKDEGTELFKGANYAKAIERYIQATAHLEKFVEELNEKEKGEVEALRLSLYLNLSVCYAKLDAWGKSLANADLAVKLDGKNIKALFRRAQARLLMKEYQGAAEDAAAARQLEGEKKDPALAKLAEQIAQKIADQKANEKKVYGRMFA